METLFRNTKIEIWVKSSINEVYAITVFDPSLAYAVNSVLAHYPKRHKFEKGEEPVFPFGRRQIDSIGQKSRIIQKALAQVIKA